MIEHERAPVKSAPRLLQNKRPTLVDEDRMLEVEVEGVNQRAAFDVLADLHELADRGAIAYLDYLLGDDRALVEILVGKVGGGADEFDPFVPRLVVGLGAFKRREESVVDVDHPVLPLAGKLRAENLHKAGHHDEIDLVFGQDSSNSTFRTLFPLLVIDVVEGNAELAGNRLVDEVVGNHDRDIAVELVVLVFEQELPEAVICLADEDGDALPPVHREQVPVHAESFGDRRKGGAEGGLVKLRRDLKSAFEDKHVHIRGSVLGEIEDVGPALCQHGGNGGDNPRLVGTAHFDDVLIHGPPRVGNAPADGKGLSIYSPRSDSRRPDDRGGGIIALRLRVAARARP